MVKIENRCVGCTDIGLHCIGSHCPNRNVEVYYCDKCGDEICGEVHDEDGCDLCDDCYDEYSEEGE